jgi:RHS repeat-associated protein
MKKLYPFIFLFPVFVLAQSLDQNFVKTITYKVPTTTALTSPTINQASQSVTYFDGLGRAIQQVAYQESATGKDIITHIEYDAFGRQAKEFLPFASLQNSSSYINPVTLVPDLISQYKTKYGIVNANPFSEKLFEASPLNRVLKQAAPGDDWKLNSTHEIKIEYQTNGVSDVLLYIVSLNLANNTYAPTLSLSTANSGFYLPNELYKTITKDENWVSGKNNTTEEFKNKEGKVVLKRTYSDYQNPVALEVAHDTYYVYDSFGNLTYVIPPLVTSPTTQLNDLCYQYVYDYRNRLVEKKLPAKQWEYIVYDKLDRPVASGPALSPFNDTATGAVGWFITKYDVFSRPVYTGWLPSTTITSSGRITMQNNQNTATTINETKQSTGTIDNINAYYSNLVVPTSFKLLSVKYYDTYTFPSTPTILIPTSVEGQTILSTTQVKGLDTASWMRVPTTSTATLGETSVTFYDTKARPIRNYTTNHHGGYTYTDTNLDFIGKTIYSITKHRRLSGSAELTTREDFTYSAQDRLEIHSHKINSDPVELLQANTYDELGQLIEKKVGNTSAVPVQKVNYSYNIRGWLTNINDTAGLQQGVDPKDLFAFKINYNTIATGISGVTALYNGNIAETFWNTATDPTATLRAYGYQYDHLNRLKSAVYKKNTTVSNAYNESLTYDKNGNIKSLVRYGGSDASATPMDNLTYTYGATNTNNQLMMVSDSFSTTTGFIDGNTVSNDYSYDLNGNLLKDLNKGIGTSTTDGITYNHLNLPTKIIFASGANTGNIVYIYNAVGQKVQKIVTQLTPTANTTTTDYLGTYQYIGTILQFFPTAEGYVEPIASSFKYIFQYKDHLGNARLSYDKNLQIIEENNYYPFGLKHNGYNPTATSTNVALKYKYNGKELQDELGLNWYDYQARNYDPAIGRWMTIDPLTEVSRRWSPYTYCYNNPLIFTDPDGMLATPPTDLFNMEGKKIGTDGVDNGAKMVVKDKAEATQISKTEGNIDLSTVKSGVALPSDAALKESLNVLDRTVKNGGYKEETSLVMKSGTVVQGQTGPMPTIVKNIATAPSNLPNLPAGTTISDVEASIHSHPTKVQQVGNTIYPQSASIPSTGTVGTDQQAFPQFQTNIIVGPIGTVNPNNVTANPNGSLNIPSRTNGVSIYNNSSLKPQVELSKKAVQNILK